MKIGILEDEKIISEEINKYLTIYFKKKDELVTIESFDNAFDLTENYNADFDVLFMDIQLPNMSGMQAAHKIRKTDTNVIIVFVTNLVQYAVEGYQVNAFDFILKPIDYNSFTLKLDRICREIAHNSSENSINIKTKNGVIRLNISCIRYIEVKIHDLIFYTDKGRYITRGAMKNIAIFLSSYYFSLCNSCYLVNLAYVRQVNKFAVLTTGENLLISQGKRKQFMSDLARYAGDTI